MSRRLGIGLALVLGFGAALAEGTLRPPIDGFTPERIFPGQRFDPAIPTFAETIGIEHGERPVRAHEILRWFETLAEASPRARLTTYAHSHEGRPLVVMAVGDAPTIAELEAFQAAHAARVDPRGRPASGDAAVLDGARAVAWLGHSIHGDELSGADAACALAYWLVAGQGGLAERIRRDLVVLIDPAENPDGRERYLSMLQSFQHRVPTTDQEDLSHAAVWPWGRGNHYLFDLNRDWFSLVHPESARSERIAAWNPQLMVDAHEMGADSSYLFSPSRHPFNPLLPPNNGRWAQRFGRDQATELDRRGYPYFTREWNEEFFPGYGSSWASYRGAIGILYEMSRTSGHVVKKVDGSLRSFAQGVEHQAASSLANLRTLLDNREAILADFVADRRAAIAAARSGEAVGSYLLPEGRHPERTRALVSLLQRQGIEVLRGGSAPEGLGKLIDVRSGAASTVARLAEERRWNTASWIVPLDQPAAPLVRVLLDPHVPMETTFLREQREYLERGRGSRLYDATAWSLPLAYDVEAFWSRAVARDGEAATPAEPVGLLEEDDDALSFVIDGGSDRVARALAALQARDLHVRVARRPFRIGGRDYGHGSLSIRREGNPDDLAEQLHQVAHASGVEIHAVGSALAERGPDLGGSHFRPLIAPRIAVLAGWPVSPTHYGAVWRLLDDHGVRFTSLDVGRFGRAQLDRYNVLVFPNASGSYAAVLGDAGRQRLERWVEAGGTVIGIGSGAEFLADAELQLTQTRLRSQAIESFPSVVLGPPAEQVEPGAPLRAIGVRAPAEKESDDAAPVGSPYDVAPVIGAGARPFVAGVDLGTPFEGDAVSLAKWVEPWLPDGRSKAAMDDLLAADARLRRFSPEGAFLRVELDGDVWLNWGLPAEIAAYVNHDDTLVADAGVQVAARFVEVERLHLGGLLWPEAAGRLAHTAYATREARGRGQIVLFLNEPEFRGWTLGTRRLLLNAMLLGPGLGTRWSRPW